MVSSFTMLNNGEPVECAISSAALDALAGSRGTAPEAKEALFESNRIDVERIASNIFDNNIPLQGAVVRVFAKHIPVERKCRRPSALSADPREAPE
jgi:hypothetical protein